MVANLLAEASHWTWHFLRDAPFRPREETITELLLTDFVRHGAGAVQVYKASIAEEGDWGLDWAWALQTSGGWLHMLIQAKQVRGRRWGWYEELRKDHAEQQATQLIEAGTYFNAVPAFAFYNSEVVPFGPKGNQVSVGACGRGAVERDDAAEGLPWHKGTSPLGVTLAHADDVQSFVLGPPHTRQRATSVNAVSMPLECVVCPNTTSTGLPSGIWRVAEAIRNASSDPDGALRADTPWLTSEPPDWAVQLAEGRDPSVSEDAPAARYFVRTSAPSVNDIIG